MSVVYLAYAFLVGAFLVGFGIKIGARIKRRYGPPLHQPLRDVLKLLGKRSISHGLVQDLGVWMALAGSALLVLTIPVKPFPYIKVDLVAFAYIAVIAPLGMALGTAQVANPYASAGIARALMLMTGYELPVLLTVVFFYFSLGTTTLSEIVELQRSGWFISKYPLLAVGYYLALLGEMGKQPFDIAIAPSEIASGPMVEYGGKYLGFLFIYTFFHTFVSTALFSVLFLGGGAWWEVLLKQLLLYFTLVVVASSFPRFVSEKAVLYQWLVPSVFVLLNFVLVVVS